MARNKSAHAASRVENTIEPSAVRVQPGPPLAQPTQRALGIDGQASSAERADGSKTGRGLPAPGPASSGGVAKDTTTVPEAVRDRFMSIREKYFFPNGEPAFQDLGVRLTTRSENAEVVRSLVEIAQARGWDEISVGGTKEFKRAVWHEATLQKIAVRGYGPTEVDEARVVQALARRAQRSREEEPAVLPESSASGARSEPRASPEPPRASRSTESLPQGNVFRGELLEHGAENYKLDPHEDMSYLVKLRTDAGRVIELWGRDFERAFKESKSAPKVGDRVEVRSIGNKEVTVPRKERDGQGNIIREYDLRTHRNAWTIESAAFLEERAQFAKIVADPSVDPREVVKASPQLAGTMAELRAAELVGQSRYPTDQRAQKGFVDAVRVGLADQIRRGEPLRAPLLRDRPRVQDRGSATPTAPAPAIAPVR